MYVLLLKVKEMPISPCFILITLFEVDWDELYRHKFLVQSIRSPLLCTTYLYIQ